MQHRPLRPGDVVDDYCPRERRLTDHAIVAMIEDEIKQTRCASCDTEHEYKRAKVPVRRKKAPNAALFGQVLDGLQPPGAAPRPAVDAVDSAPDPPPPSPSTAQSPPPSEPLPFPASVAGLSDEDREQEGPVQRPLIRAQLPRVGGQPPTPRQLPDFTARYARNDRAPRQGGGGHGFDGQRRRGAEMFQFPSGARTNRHQSDSRAPQRDSRDRGFAGPRGRRDHAAGPARGPVRGGKKR